MDNMKKTAGLLQAQGRHGDTILAHINPEEAKMLKAAGGSGTINPETGLPEYFSLGKLFKAVAVGAAIYFSGGAAASALGVSGAAGASAAITGAAIGGGISSYQGGNILQGALMGGIGGFVAGGGLGSPSDWLAKTGETFGNTSVNAATKAAETTASTAASQAGISTNAADFLNAGGSPTNIPGTGFPGSMSGAATGATGGVIPPATGGGLLDKAMTWAGNNPVPALMAGQTVMAGIGGMATAESQAEQAQLNRDAQLQRDTVQGGFSNPRAVTVRDPNLVTDVAGRYIRGPRAGQYAPGRAPGLLNAARV